MAVGIQIFDANGNSILDSTTSVYQEYDNYTVTEDGSISLPAEFSGSTATFEPISAFSVDELGVDPATNTVSWKFTEGSGVLTFKVALY